MLNYKKLFNFISVNKLSRQKRTYENASKRTKKIGWSFVKGFVYIEVGCLIGAYLFWRKMNNSQDFRFYLKNNWPTILEGKF